MTSRRAASIASRFSSRFSSRYSARLSPPLAPPTPRLRWAAALAVAYLAVAGCAAGRQREPAAQAAASRHRRLRPRLPSPPRARCCRRRASSTATCSSRCRPRSSIPTRRPSSTRRPMAIRRRSCSVSATEIAAGLLAEGVRRPAFHAAAGRRRDAAAEPDAAPAHRLAVAAAHAHEHDGAAVQLADPAAEAVCRARRPLPRRLLLGHLFHDARAAGVGPRGSRRQHARQLRPSDRHDRAHPERQPHVLREPLAAAVLRVHGHARRAGRRRQGLSEIPAGTAQGTCVLDAGRSHDAARAGHAPCGRDARRRGAEPLLGRERYAARRVVSRGRDDREVGAGASGERGLPRPARGRQRLGLQLALVRRRQDARDDPHDVDRAGRPEQPDVPSRDDDREGLRGHARRGMRDRFFRARRGGRPRSTAICGTAKATTATTTGSSASRATR